MLGSKSMFSPPVVWFPLVVLEVVAGDTWETPGSCRPGTEIRNATQPTAVGGLAWQAELQSKPFHSPKSNPILPVPLTGVYHGVLKIGLMIMSLSFTSGSTLIMVEDKH